MAQGGSGATMMARTEGERSDQKYAGAAGTQGRQEGAAGSSSTHG